MPSRNLGHLSIIFGALSIPAAIAISLLQGCGSSSSNNSSSTSTRTINSNTTVAATISTAFDGTSATCSQLTRDTSSCLSTRQALGLSGNWLNFSCNVVVGCANSSKVAMTTCTGATYYTLTTDALPDYTSNYWSTSGTYSYTAYSYTVTGSYSSLYSAFTTAFPDPNYIAARSATMYVPLTPAYSGTQTMSMGTVGMALNGVFIYDSVAGNTDNIFTEGGSFDQCGGHPDTSSTYHYHGEPYSISYQDSNLIGVLMDGYFAYGRNDSSSATGYTSSPAGLTAPGSVANILANADNNGDGLSGGNTTLYKYGGHVGIPPNLGSSTFHYHLTEWKGCYDEVSPGGTKDVDDGETMGDTYNSGPSGGTCAGYTADAWFITGHGNGGVYATIPAGLHGQIPSQTLTAVRYYYGTPGTCTNCP